MSATRNSLTSNTLLEKRDRNFTLTPYQTIPIFKDPERRGASTQTDGKKRKGW